MEELSSADSRRYAKIHGQIPSTILGRHADGRHIALQAMDVPLDRAGVWDIESGKLLWEPKDTVAVAWIPNGDQVLAVTHHYKGSAKHPRDFHAVRQSEIGCELTRYTWPELQAIASCPLALPTGWFTSVIVSPVGTRAAVAWIEQDVAGFVVAEVGNDKDVQLVGAGYQTKPNNVSMPVFAPDGRHIVIGCGKSFWWNSDTDPSEPSPGGTFEVGHIAVYEMDAGPVREQSIQVDLPEGWIPDDPEDPRFELIGDPHFTGPSSCAVRLPNGEERFYETTDVGG